MTADLPPILVQGSGLVVGAILGSFIATLILRWPQGRSVVTGRSACDHCGAPLGLRDLIPLFSYAALHGRCRRCGQGIDRRHLLVEVGAAGIGLVALLAHPLPLAAITALLGLWLLTLALLDLQYQWLPDRLTLPLIPLGLVAAWAGFGPPLEQRLVGAAAGFLLLAGLAVAYQALRKRRGLGGGDPKMLAAIGAWVGWTALPFVLLGAGLAGLLSVLLMRWRGQDVKATTRLPLGTFLALAAWPAWLLVAASSWRS